jgi:hypothetical protein
MNTVTPDKCVGEPHQYVPMTLLQELENSLGYYIRKTSECNALIEQIKANPLIAEHYTLVRKSQLL